MSFLPARGGSTHQAVESDCLRYIDYKDYIGISLGVVDYTTLVPIPAAATLKTQLLVWLLVRWLGASHWSEAFQMISMSTRKGRRIMYCITCAQHTEHPGAPHAHTPWCSLRITGLSTWKGLSQQKGPKCGIGSGESLGNNSFRSPV